MKLGDVKSERQRSHKMGEYQKWQVLKILERIEYCMLLPIDGGSPAHTEHDVRTVCNGLYKAWENHGSKTFYDKAQTTVLHYGLPTKIYPPSQRKLRPQEKTRVVSKQVVDLINDTMSDVGTRPKVVKFIQVVIPSILYQPNMSDNQLRQKIMDHTTKVFGEPKVKKDNGKPSKPTPAPKTPETKPKPEAPDVVVTDKQKIDMEAFKNRMKERMKK
jgi:hypothetical protein